MRQPRHWITVALLTGIVLTMGVDPARSDGVGLTVLDLRTRAEKGEYTVAFCMQEGAVGHALVVFGETSARPGRSDVEAFGLYPKVGVLGLPSIFVGPVPRAVVDKVLEGDVSGFIPQVLVCQVNAADYEAADAMRRKWASHPAGQVTSRDCIAFVGDVARRLGLRVPAATPDLTAPLFVRELICSNRIAPPLAKDDVTKRSPALSVDLPRVGTLGCAPSGDDTIVVTVTGEGRILVDGKGPLSLEGLRDEMTRRTADPTWREPDRSSRKRLLVNADASLPWEVSQWVLQTAADPSVGLYKIFFGARPQDGTEAGAIGWTLPKDRGIQETSQFVEEQPMITVDLFSRPGKTPSDPDALYPVLRRIWAQAGNDPAVQLEIKAPPPYGRAVPTGFVVRVLDVAIGVGLSEVRFEGAAPPSGPDLDSVEWLLGYVAALKDQGGAPYIRVGNERLTTLPAGAPKPPARGLLPGPHGFGIAATSPRQGPRVTIRAETTEEELDEIPEEAREVHGGEVVVPEPVIRDAEITDHVETDGDLPFEESVGEDGISDAPFRGPANPGLIGVGGGAGGAFRGRGGHRNLGARSGARRAKVAVQDALRWLAAHQSPDGSWDCDGFNQWCDGKPVPQGPDGAGKGFYDAGTTGLALCAYLGAGYTNRGRHPFAKNVARGLRYLKNIQDADGCFGPRTSYRYIYNHGPAALAMIEAYGLTGSPIFKESAQRTLDFIAIARNPYFAWRYGVRPGDNDTSVTGWMMMSLYAAKLINEDAIRRGKPVPLVIDEDAFDGIRAWIDKMTDPETGRTGYIQRGGASARSQELIDRFPGDLTESMTAVGMLARIFTGEDPRLSETIQKGARLCIALPPVWNATNGRIDMYYWYYATLAMFQVGGSDWRVWNAHLRTAVLDNQRKGTTYCGYKGSWDPIGPWGPDGGRIYATAMLAMCLEVAGRYDKAFGK